MEEEWRMDMDLEGEVESREKLDEQKRKLHKELRDVEKFSCLPKEFQENLKSNLQQQLQQQLQEVEQRRHDLMPEHQRVRKRSQKIQNIQDKGRSMQKENVAAGEEVRKLREDVKQEEERIFFLSDKVEKNKMADAEMAAELQGLQAGGERRGSDVSQTGDCYLDELFRKVIALGTNGVEALFERVRREMGALPEHMPGGGGGRKDSENEQEQGKASQQLALSASGGFSESTSARSVELDLPRVRAVHGECGGAGPMEEDTSLRDL